MKYTVRILLCIIVMSLQGITSQKVYADPSDYVFYEAMIKNQIIEIATMLLEVERELSRYKRLLELPLRITSRAMEEMEDLEKIHASLMNKAGELLTALEQDASEAVAWGLKEIDDTLHNARKAILKWNLEKEQYLNEQIQQQKANIQASASIVTQTQITNESLLVLTAQMDTLLEMVLEIQKVVAAEKSHLYLEKKKHEEFVDKKVNDFFTQESSFSRGSTFNSKLYTRR